jgi:hypothetical protein
MSVSYALADIHQDDVSIAISQQTISGRLKCAVEIFLDESPNFKIITTMSSNDALAEVSQFANGTIPTELAGSIALHVDTYCKLFKIDSVRLSLTAINHVMCPQFHTDRVTCRLITSYCGPATEWLPHDAVDRSKLGLGNNGLPDHLSGLYEHDDDIQQLDCGDIALLKGTLWAERENAGQVHRSPSVGPGERRLLLTLDFGS